MCDDDDDGSMCVYFAYRLLMANHFVHYYLDTFITTIVRFSNATLYFGDCVTVWCGQSALTHMCGVTFPFDFVILFSYLAFNSQ